MNSKNLQLWESVEKTNPSMTKNFKGKGGFNGTAISATYQIKQATAQFGAMGIGWGIKDEVFDYHHLPHNEGHDDFLMYSATLWYKLGEQEAFIPIAADIPLWNYSVKWKSWSATNDHVKKIRTDAMTKGLSQLGFNADVHLGMFDDNKYVQSLKDEQRAKNAEVENAKALTDALAQVKASNNREVLTQTWSNWKVLQKNEVFVSAVKAKGETFANAA